MPWTLAQELEKTFRDMKAKLTSDCVLVQYDLTNKLVLACNTSLYSIGAVLSHCFKNGQERLITFASHPLIPEEKFFSQIEEGLAIIYGIKISHAFIWMTFPNFVRPQVNQLMLSASKRTPTIASYWVPMTTLFTINLDNITAMVIH